MGRYQKVSRVQEKVAHFSPGETAYQDCSRGTDKVPVSKEMIYGQSFALTLTLIYCFYTLKTAARPPIWFIYTKIQEIHEFSSSSSQVILDIINW